MPKQTILASTSMGVLLLITMMFCGGPTPTGKPPTGKSPTTSPDVTEQPSAAEKSNGTWYQLYFSSPKYPDDAKKRSPAPIAQALVKVINSAKKTLDIAIYELNLPELGDAILAARDRGVTVRMVTDSDEIDTSDVLIRLKKSKIPIVPDERSPIMHNKFVVVDKKAVWLGSWNFTQNDTYRNNNNAIYIQSPQLAANYTTEFEEMFTDHAFGPTSPANTPNPKITIDGTVIENCFAPEDKCGDQVIAVIKQAKKSIYFMAFSFTHGGIGDVVIERAKKGIKVQGLFESRGSETKYSEFGVMEKLKLDVLKDGNPYNLHHKVFIVDGQTVIMGSFNFSQNADEANDENLLIIHNAAIAKQYTTEFKQVYQVAVNPPK